VSRVFDAPPEVVYQAFVDADQLAQWWGPEGCSLRRETIESDVRPGGCQRFVMVVRDEPNLQIQNTITFTEVIENELLVGRCDVDGAPGHHEALSVGLRLEFHSEPGGRTRLELRQGLFDEASEVHDAWLESFTKLDSVLGQPR